RIPFAEDFFNRDPWFLRTRVRQEVVPLLKALSPRIVEHLCDLADAAGSSSAVALEEFQGQRLGRAQRTALRNALETRNARARVPLAGGKILRVDLSTGKIVLMHGE